MKGMDTASGRSVALDDVASGEGLVDADPEAERRHDLDCFRGHPRCGALSVAVADDDRRPAFGRRHGMTVKQQRASESVEQAKQWLAPLIGFLDGGGCVGQLPELFEPEEPQRPKGCFAQAWSVAEVLRLAVMLGL